MSIGRISKMLASLRHRRDGAVLAELALTLPILLLLFGASVELSRAVYQYNVVAKSVQEATRFLARRAEVSASGECPPTGDWGGAVTRAQNLALTGSLSAAAAYRLPHWTDPASVTVTVRCQAAGTMISSLSTNAGTALPIVQVSATVPFNDVGLLGLLGIDSLQISAEHSELGTGG